MNNLHKKIGVGVLSAALLVGVPMASVSFIQDGQLGVSVVEAYNQNPMQILQSIQKARSQQEKEKYNKEVVVGLRDIFKYHVVGVGSNIRLEQVQSPREKEVIEVADGNGFLQHLALNGARHSRHYLFKVGQEFYIIQFYENIQPGKMWWLELGKWVYGVDVYLKPIRWN